MIILESHTVPKIEQSERLSDYLIGKFKNIPSRKGIKKAIEKGRVKLNGNQGKTADWVQEGDIIHLYELESKPKPYELDLEILFQDDDLAVINKPAGIPVSGNQFKTIQNTLLHNFDVSKADDALPFPRPVHRLDSQTSGLLIVARSYQAMIKLGQMFEEKRIQKSYHTIVCGRTVDSMEIADPIDGQTAFTSFQKIQEVRSLKNDYLSLLKVDLKTGRTHQIRIHLSGIRHPIFGDKLYGEEGNVFKGKGLFLAATNLEFFHPITGEKILIEIPIPNKFSSLLKREQRRWDQKFIDNPSSSL